MMSEFECEACAKEFAAMNILLSESDRLVAKALVLSEVAQIARAEYRMNQLLSASWNLRAKQAAEAAGARARSGAGAKEILASVNKYMGKWPTDVAKPYTNSIAEIYKLARTAGLKKANNDTKSSLQYSSALLDKLSEPVEKAKRAKVKPDFDLLDDSAIDALQDDQMIWIGEHYDSNVSVVVRSSVEDTMKLGLGRNDAGLAVSMAVKESLARVQTPGGFYGTQAQYFEGLAANTATNSRVRGQVRSFVDVGVTRFVLVNPMDRRTSEICQHMNGKVFLIEDAVQQIEKEAGATHPDHVRAAHPWMSYKELSVISPKSGDVGRKDTAALAKNGIVLPPFHFRCRTTVDISHEYRYFSSLTNYERKTLISIPRKTSPTRSNTPKPTPKSKVPKSGKHPTKRPATLPIIS